MDKQLSKIVIGFIWISISFQLYAPRGYAQTTKRSCDCPQNQYAQTKGDTTFHLSNGKSIALCGYQEPGSKPIVYSEFVLSDCARDSVIDFWRAVLDYHVEVKADTILLKRLEYLHVGKDFKEQEVVWSTEKLFWKGQKVIREKVTNLQLQNPYNADEIEAVLRAYESASPDLSYGQGIVPLEDKLFAATISGSIKARQYFEEMPSKFNHFGGAITEYHSRLQEMLRSWDRQQTDIKPELIHRIEKLKVFFRNGETDSIAKYIRYPIDRSYPVPNIHNKQEFVSRFDSVFDEHLVEVIAKSEIRQWSAVGWRGIMLNSGVVWIGYDGKIKAINYRTKAEKKQRKDQISQTKNEIYPSLRHFKRTVFKVETKHYHIRIDELKNNIYRYASWKKGVPEAKKPELVLREGKLNTDGNGGNYHINFTNGNYEYVLYRNIISSKNTPEAHLIIKKDGNIIQQADGNIVRK